MMPLSLRRFSLLLGAVGATLLASQSTLAAMPTAVAQAVLTAQNSPVTITLRGVSPDGRPLEFRIAGKPAHGTLGPLNTSWKYQSKVVYTPYNGYVGPDSFTFKVAAGSNVSAAATVNLTVGYAVSGKIADAAGNPIPNVTLRFRPLTGSPNRYATTGDDGRYWAPLPPGWSGTAVNRDKTPILTPAVRTYNNLRANLTNNDYLAGPESTTPPTTDPGTPVDPGTPGDPTTPPDTDPGTPPPPNQPPPPPPAAARVWYVAPTGNDSNAGDLNAPFRSVQRAADIAQAGEAICLREGDYNVAAYPNGVIHFANSGQPGNPIIVTAYGNEKVTLHTSASKPIFDFTTVWGNNTVGFGHYYFSKFKITGGRAGWMFDPPAITGWNTNRPVSDLFAGQIHDVTIEDIEVDGRGGVETAIKCRNAGVRNLTVRRCDFHHTIGTEGTIDIGEWRDEDIAHSIPASAAHNLLFEDCLLHETAHQQANGIVTQPCVFNVTMRRCLVWNNGKYGIAFKGSGNFKVDRCAVWGNRETSMYCRGFGGDSGAERPPAPSQFLLTNNVFIAPADQSGGSALNWRENTDVTAYNCTIVGLRNASLKQAGGYAWLLGNDHAIPCVARIHNCIIVGLNDSNAVRFYTPNGLTYPINVRYEAGTNLFYCTNPVQFRMQRYSYPGLAGWQGYWATGAPGGDDGLHGPRATNADRDSLFADPLFAVMNPAAAPLARQWTAEPFDAANHLNVRLQAGSPAVGNGANLSGLGIPELAVDYSGDPRPTTGAWTIGAFQNPVP